MHKYVHGNGQSIVHCPSCRGVLFKTMPVERCTGDCSMELFLRCPHCTKNAGASFNIVNGRVEITVYDEAMRAPLDSHVSGEEKPAGD